MFGLLNANARLYSPYLGRFVSPDPLLNSEGGPLDYNPYIYARNNPYKYIDRNGEFWWLIAFTALAAGGANVAYNWNNIHSFGDALGYFGAGAAPVCKIALYAGATFAGVGLVTAGIIYGGPFIAAGLGIAGTTVGEVAGVVIAGALCGGLHNVYQAGLDSWFYGTPFEFSWSSCLTEAAITGVTAGFCKYLDIKAAKAIANQSKIMSHRPAMTNPDKLAPLPSDDLPIYSHADPADVLKQKPLQNHHFATNKNSKFTPKMEKIANKYGLDLNGEWNIEKLPHQGRHSNGYNNWVYKNMQIMDMMPDMNQARFIKEFEQRVKMPIRNNPDMLYKKYWQ